VPGTALVRKADGGLYFLTLNIQQIDMTDDYVVISIFGDGAWESSIQRIVARDDGGIPTDVYLDLEAFWELETIMGGKES
jgi:hypothetical protein